MAYHGASVVGCGDGPEALLTRRVPADRTRPGIRGLIRVSDSEQILVHLTDPQTTNQFRSRTSYLDRNCIN